MILLGILLFIILVFLYFLGYIPKTLYYTRKRFINLCSSIKTEKNCDSIAYKYNILVGLIKELLENHNLDIYEDAHLIYIFNDVVQHVNKYCPKIMECKSLSFDEIECDKKDSKMFEDYYMKNLNKDNKEYIEFHDIEKNNQKITYPCSINVYDDFYTTGYMFDINNVKKDGMCKREINRVIQK